MPAKTKSPLWKHQSSGQWCKKHKGKFYYFGTEEEAALEQFYKTWDAIISGRPVVMEEDVFSIRDCLDRFLEDREDKVATGEVAQRTWNSYKSIVDRIAECLPLTMAVDALSPEHFARLKRHLATRMKTQHSLQQAITICRLPFNHAYDFGYIDRPVRMNKFSVDRKSLRREKSQRRDRSFSADELWKLTNHATHPACAYVLLGINCALGATDIVELRCDDLDLRAGRLDYPRPKTGVSRFCTLWPETMDALRPAYRVAQKTKHRRLYPRVRETVQERFKTAMRKVGVEADGRTHYDLRRTFATVASELSQDEKAIRVVMGHVSDDSMLSRYQQRQVSWDRLETLTNLVRNWLHSAD